MIAQSGLECVPRTLLRWDDLEQFFSDGFVEVVPRFPMRPLMRTMLGRAKVHVVDGRYPYAADNWLQRPASMPFRGFET